MRWTLKHSLVLTLSVLLCSAQAHLPLSQSSSCGAVILQGFTFGPRDLSTHRLLKSKSGHLSQHVYFLLILFTGEVWFQSPLFKIAVLLFSSRWEQCKFNSNQIKSNAPKTYFLFGKNKIFSFQSAFHFDSWNVTKCILKSWQRLSPNLSIYVIWVTGVYFCKTKGFFFDECRCFASLSFKRYSNMPLFNLSLLA